MSTLGAMFQQCASAHLCAVLLQILRSVDAPFESVNILENEALRSGMKEYSQWPTFPQVRRPHMLLAPRP
jgi:monothiol glutaredoxin